MFSRGSSSVGMFSWVGEDSMVSRLSRVSGFTAVSKVCRIS